MCIRDRLRQYSAQTQEARTEFDVDETIRETCDNAGTLSVCYKLSLIHIFSVIMITYFTKVFPQVFIWTSALCHREKIITIIPLLHLEWALIE